MPIHTVAVGGFITNENNQVLLVKSPLREWEFPGGIVEPGESLPQALMREIREESGATVNVAGLIGIYTNIQKNIVNIDFRCVYEYGELTTSEESIEVGWFTIDQAKDMITYPLYIHRFQNMIKFSDLFYCEAFQKEPFTITETYQLPRSYRSIEEYEL